MKPGCPRKMCFNWRSKGTLYASGMHDSLDEAFSKMQVIAEGSCGWHLGVCIRINANGEGDFYEPAGPGQMNIAKYRRFRLKRT